MIIESHVTGSSKNIDITTAIIFRKSINIGNAYISSSIDIYIPATLVISLSGDITDGYGTRAIEGNTTTTAVRRKCTDIADVNTTGTNATESRRNIDIATAIYRRSINAGNIYISTTIDCDITANALICLSGESAGGNVAIAVDIDTACATAIGISS